MTLDSNMSDRKVTVTNIGLLLANKAKNLNAIRDKSKAQISIPERDQLAKDEKKSVEVTILGDVHSVKLAADAIEALMKNVRRSL